MARVAIPITVVKPDPANANALIPAQAASVTVRKRSDNTVATVYTAETGGTGSTAALATDAFGRVTGWVDRGAYKLDVTGSGITSYSEIFDAAPAGDNTVDTPWLAQGALPVGSLMAWAGGGDPAGGSWLVCDGRALSRSGYATLFGAIGATYGPGDGSTTFNLPDLRGRHPLGAGTGGGLTSRTLGAGGGEETHQLTVNELAAHGHVIRTFDSQTGIGDRLVPSGLNNSGPHDVPGGANGSQNAGGDQAHNNMAPFLVVNFIIRAL